MLVIKTYWNFKLDLEEGQGSKLLRRGKEKAGLGNQVKREAGR